MSIRSNFFYTRSVPCELWFFDKGKPKERQDKVLMIDARNVYRKVTRKINDFSPEQLKKLENAKKQTISHLNKLQEELNPVSKSCEDLAKDSDSFLKSLLKLTDSLKEKSISDKKETFPTKEATSLAKQIQKNFEELL